MRYLSVCSGIEAASVAWKPLGWTAAGYSEIEPFPRAVLQARFGAEPVDWDHRYGPQSNMLPLFGDFTKIEEHHVGPIDLLVGGTPCQSFSIAGLRGGLDDDRGNLALEFLRLAQRTRPKWLVWENVPGVLSSNGGRDFGAILGGMVELGYGFAYRVLDAQYFGVPQRRRRVFVVGHLGDWRPAAAVLFERHSLQGRPSPRREKGKEIAGTLESRASGGGGGPGAGTDGAAAGYLQPIAFDLAQITSATNRSNAAPGLPASTISKHSRMHVASTAVRRLTPVECERLQGFPDNYTLIPYRNKPAEQCPDGPRYKALGNSMAVPVMRWIGERIDMVERMFMEQAA